MPKFPVRKQIAQTPIPKNEQTKSQMKINRDAEKVKQVSNTYYNESKKKKNERASMGNNKKTYSRKPSQQSIRSKAS